MHRPRVSGVSSSVEWAASPARKSSDSMYLRQPSSLLTCQLRGGAPSTSRSGLGWHGSRGTLSSAEHLLFGGPSSLVASSTSWRQPRAPPSRFSLPPFGWESA
ncbi:unnamed protein product [Urochloa humidicola]